MKTIRRTRPDRDAIRTCNSMLFDLVMAKRAIRSLQHMQAQRKEHVGA